MSADRRSPYRDMKPDDLILRDLLARDRTILANERTVLAYFRTALMLAASGVTLIKFFPDQPGLIAVGYLLILVSPLVLLFGIVRYLSVRSDMRRIVE